MTDIVRLQDLNTPEDVWEAAVKRGKLLVEFATEGDLQSWRFRLYKARTAARNRKVQDFTDALMQQQPQTEKGQTIDETKLPDVTTGLEDFVILKRGPRVLWIGRADKGTGIV